jgi:hypothetical protein
MASTVDAEVADCHLEQDIFLIEAHNDPAGGLEKLRADYVEYDCIQKLWSREKLMMDLVALNSFVLLIFSC